MYESDFRRIAKRGNQLIDRVDGGDLEPCRGMHGHLAWVHELLRDAHGKKARSDGPAKIRWDNAHVRRPRKMERHCPCR